MKQKSMLSLALLVALVPLIVRILTTLVSWLNEYKEIKAGVYSSNTVPVIASTENPVDNG